MSKKLNTVEPQEWKAVRPCGECQACCKALPVIATKPPMNKPPGERCSYQCEEGCSIYETRPSPCRSYLCQWAIGWGAEEWRPDKWGLIVEANTMTMAITVSELWPGAINQPEFRQIVPLLAKQSAVLIQTTDKRMIILAADQAEVDRLKGVQEELEVEYARIVALAEAAMQSDCTEEGA